MDPRKKNKMIKEVRSAVFEEIESYLGAHHTKDGLLEYLQRKEWKFPKEYFNIYGENHTHFDIFDTQEHLDDFIKNIISMNKVSVKPSQIDIPSSFLKNIAETNTIEMAGKEYTDGEEVKNDMEKIILEKGANLDDAINEEAKQFQNLQMANKK